MTSWAAHERREQIRYDDGLARLPADPDARQRQIVRVANAACGAGLACLMDRRDEEARVWFRRAADRYRESYAHAPPESFGRLIGAVKMRLLAEDSRGLQDDAAWALGDVPEATVSPIGRYAACLSALVLGHDDLAVSLAKGLAAEPAEVFPQPVAQALSGLASRNADVYRQGLEATLASFEERDAYLEDVPVADTVLALEALAASRGLTVGPRSRVLPAP